MALINAYNGKNTSGGNTLVDMVDANNGIFGGASLPVINANGYITFTGNNGTTKGNRQRIEFTRIQKTVNDVFSVIVELRQGTITQQQSIINTFNANVGNAAWILSRSVTGQIAYAQVIGSTSGARSCTISVPSNVYPKGFHSQTGVFNATTETYAFLNNTQSAVVTSAIVGNLYLATAKTLFGATWYNTTADYGQDFNGDMVSIKIFNHKLTNAEISQYNNALAGVI